MSLFSAGTLGQTNPFHKVNDGLTRLEREEKGLAEFNLKIYLFAAALFASIALGTCAVLFMSPIVAVPVVALCGIVFLYSLVALFLIKCANNAYQANKEEYLQTHPEAGKTPVKAIERSDLPESLKIYRQPGFKMDPQKELASIQENDKDLWKQLVDFKNVLLNPAYSQKTWQYVLIVQVISIKGKPFPSWISPSYGDPNPKGHGKTRLLIGPGFANLTDQEKGIKLDFNDMKELNDTGMVIQYQFPVFEKNLQISLNDLVKYVN
jgi:hypothetical protein